ncbi:hypothetical protein [Deinococcus soli (ex Cha et al. 2016)]|uniref:Uncharacterized protein n=2 Tax=Deinococcus soli (ex Cha et al. 2016) TaxID=1309411 RepID=A0ACC6KH45_9DEIO|nr:hypothetical protein [Deinococcus soli (ex Cha et al. 2016)]MDR6218895.1 hypothetical protein [Deinococcus soli (ex Cha et al. 2016)]MDR6328692.1 hypothetical protein [Deinococcus soli (ex Cha et al. 2016)]MDR6751821.1 hypothetical protein [Deinococcus soli (ex Cha et al. 2016)]
MAHPQPLTLKRSTILRYALTTHVTDEGATDIPDFRGVPLTRATAHQILRALDAHPSSPPTHLRVWYKTVLLPFGEAELRQLHASGHLTLDQRHVSATRRLLREAETERQLLRLNAHGAVLTPEELFLARGITQLRRLMEAYLPSHEGLVPFQKH